MGMKPIRIAALAAPFVAGAAAVAVLAMPATATVGTHTGSSKVVKIKTRHQSPYGTVLTTSSGRTLYFYTRDTNKHSHCNGSCATEWPPVIVPKGHKVSGVAGLGTIKRSNGKRQAALRGKALYRYAGDTAAGQVRGQAVEGTWYVATPHGASHATAAPKPARSSPPSGGGYGY